MDDNRIDEVLKQAGPVDAALLARVTASMSQSIAPVRPLASSLTLASALFAIASLYAATVASWIGMYGVRKMTAGAIALMFSLLAVITAVAAIHAVDEMIPGSVRRIASWQLLTLAILAFAAVDAVLFQDYSLGNFLPNGVACLKAGLETAAPVGVGAWLVLRRGFAVNPPSAGLAAGTLAGLAGVVMLELHCPDFRTPHIMIWHTAVIPVAALVGMGVASLRRR